MSMRMGNARYSADPVDVGRAEPPHRYTSTVITKVRRVAPICGSARVPPWLSPSLSVTPPADPGRRPCASALVWGPVAPSARRPWSPRA